MHDWIVEAAKIILCKERPYPLFSNMSAENKKDFISEVESKPERTEDVSPPGVSLPVDVSSVESAVKTTNWLTELVTGAVDAYSRELKQSPLRTKALTSCVISMLGELIGTALKPRKRDGSRG